MSLMQFRKKPVVIGAFQFHSAVWEAYQADHEFADEGYGRIRREGDRFLIATLEGDQHIVSEGDYIIRGIVGEYYACKPDIFSATYEEVK